MIRYNSSKQLSIAEFATPFEANLDPDNRWVKLSHNIPWDDLASVYHRKMNRHRGASTIDARIVIGALIVKHRLKLSDIDTIEYIKENPYVQYFLGLKVYTSKQVFDPSLFVTIRKRLGVGEFDDMTVFLMKEEERRRDEEEKNNNRKAKRPEARKAKQESKYEKKDDQGNTTHKGTIKIDATITDADIKFPTDLELLNSAREKSEMLIDKLCIILEVEKKPRTYRRNARRDYLNLAKKKKKTKNDIRKGLRKQLSYLKRNIKSINYLLDVSHSAFLYLTRTDRKYFFVIQELYNQQKMMFDTKTNSCADRIVSIHQPHVRPMVRGKNKAKVEFGAKIGNCLHDGFARIDHLSWDAYNENSDLQKHVESYNRQHGFYPFRVLCDKIYLSRANREYLKKLKIEVVGPVLGRPTKESQTKKAKAAMRKAAGERNEVEGCFGVAKRRYAMNNIRAKLSNTAESWIGAGFFVFNIQRFLSELLFVFIFKRIMLEYKSIVGRIFDKIEFINKKYPVVQF